MNTNPSAKVVLCFGDSNTYGQKPDKLHRYVADVRWTGQLQQLLGDNYYIIEEGLGSRTTNLDYDKKPGRNGKTYLVPCLQSHKPLDIVIVMLGTNDLKMTYGRTAEQVAEALAGLVADVREYAQDRDGNPPKIILVSPTPLVSTAPDFSKFYSGYYDENSVEGSHKLSAEIEAVTSREKCGFIDAAKSAKPGDDGIHWDGNSGTTFAVALEKLVRQLA